MNLVVDPVMLKFDLFGKSFSLQWYAVMVLLGAFASYFAVRYIAKKEGKKPEIVDNLFIPCLLCGILGGRIWFVCSEWSFYFNNPSKILAIWEGGLAIQGGVIGGMIAGILMVKYKYKGEKVLQWADIILPNILIAQCIGRWGNFFNQEVYGSCVKESKLWFIPSFIKNNLHVGEAGCAVGEVVQPLFLYEGLLTLLGFIGISFILRKVWKKNRKTGVLGCLYFVYYGIVRLFMEPLRAEEFIMKLWGMSQTRLMSIIYIVGGLGVIAFLYLKDRGKKNETV